MRFSTCIFYKYWRILLSKQRLSDYPHPTPSQNRNIIVFVIVIKLFSNYLSVFKLKEQTKILKPQTGEKGMGWGAQTTKYIRTEQDKDNGLN